VIYISGAGCRGRVAARDTVGCCEYNNARDPSEAFWWLALVARLVCTLCTHIAISGVSTTIAGESSVHVKLQRLFMQSRRSTPPGLYEHRSELKASVLKAKEVAGSVQIATESCLCPEAFSSIAAALISGSWTLGCVTTAAIEL
jgi:hypothetical protein